MSKKQDKKTGEQPSQEPEPEKLDQNTINRNNRFREYSEKVESILVKHSVKNANGEYLPPPIYTNADEAFQFFVDCYAQVQFETQKHFYIDYKKGSWLVEPMERELAEIETWIKKAIDGTPYTFINQRIASYSVGNIEPYESDKKEYQKLRDKKYQDHYDDEGKLVEGEIMSGQLSVNSVSAQLYGRYFLFRDFLIEKLYGSIKPPKNPKFNPKTTLKDIWRTGDEHYAEVINYLMDENVTTGYSFVTLVDGAYKWLNKRGQGPLVQAFIKSCILNNFILDQYSSSQYLQIIKNTFQFSIDKDLMTPYGLTKIAAGHLDTFLTLPKNK